MLFVSRQIGSTKWGICDTDDMKEDIIGRADIEKLVLDVGLVIEGVDVTFNPIGRYRYVSCISPRQPAQFKTAEQAKAKVMKRIDTQVYNGVVQAISVDCTDTDVRLSDYGKSWGSYAFWFNRIGERTRFIFDDSLQFGPRTFKEWHHRPIVMDLREVTNMKLVDYVYSDYISDSQFDLDFIQYQYMDREERCLYPEALWILHNGSFASTNTHLAKLIVDSLGKTEDLIYKKYRRDFLQTCKSRLILRDNKAAKALVPVFTQRLKRHWATTCDFAVLRDSCMPELFDILLADTTISWSSLHRLQNYVAYFHITPEVRQAFVDFCHRAVSWYYSMIKE